jgi:hypothetical protein
LEEHIAATFKVRVNQARNQQKQTANLAYLGLLPASAGFLLGLLEMTCCSEMAKQPFQRYTPDDHNVHGPRCENLIQNSHEVPFCNQTALKRNM